MEVITIFALMTCLTTVEPGGALRNSCHQTSLRFYNEEDCQRQADRINAGNDPIPGLEMKCFKKTFPASDWQRASR